MHAGYLVCILRPTSHACEFSSYRGTMAGNDVESFITDVTNVVSDAENTTTDELNADATSATGTDSKAKTATASSTTDPDATAAASSGDANVAATIPKDAVAKCMLIILSMFAARLIFYATITNLDILTETFLEMNVSEVRESTLIIDGITCVFLLLSGWVADAFAGYYFAMRFGSIITLLGNVNSNP